MEWTTHHGIQLRLCHVFRGEVFLYLEQNREVLVSILLYISL